MWSQGLAGAGFCVDNKIINKFNTMKKTILGISALALIFSLNIALAKDEPSGKPFQAIWEAIDNLYAKIASIELLPGPQGQQGEKGDQGLQGEQGIPGRTGLNGEDGLNCWDINGNNLRDIEEDINSDGIYNSSDCRGPKGDKGESSSYKLVDANNQYLGDLLSANIGTDEKFVAYLPGQDIILGFQSDTYHRSATALMGGGNILYFKEKNCQGDIYNSEELSVHKVARIYNSRYFKAANNYTEEIMSYSQYYPSGICENLVVGAKRIAQLVEEVTLSFTEPLAYPLDIVSR